MSLPTSIDRPFVAGYHVYWAEDAWTDYPLELFDELFVFEIEIGRDGTVADAHGWPGRWLPMVGAAVAAGVQVVPTVSLHDPEAFEVLFADAGLVSRAVESVMDVLAASPDLAGIHLDVEVFQQVSPEARDGFTAFVVRLANTLRDRHPRLSFSVFTLAFDDDDVYNERVIGQVADYLVVQGYDYHSAGSETAGPIGALTGWGRLNWESVVARFEGFGVPARKLVMSVPLYGYEWPVDAETAGARARGAGITVPYSASPDLMTELPRASARGEAHGVRRDPVSGSPWYAYRSDDGWVQGWFEDAESLRAKYDFVRTRGLGGLALFPIAYGDAELWEALRAVFAR